tara:strand:- start:83 stop:538 length:456 start_codon:yes stop_codon:yes gene_type:complete
MDKLINKIVKLISDSINEMEDLTKQAIKDNSCKPNKSGFTNIADAFAINICYSLRTSAEWHKQKSHDAGIQAQANHKRAGSAMFWSETEHREKVVSETISELLEVFVQQAKDLGYATSWNDLKSEVKAVEIPLSSINEMREQQGLKPLTEK